VLKIAWFGEKIDQKNILKILPPPPNPFFFCFWKKRKVLRSLWFGEKIDQKNFLTILYPPSPPPQTCAPKNFRLCRWGAALGVSRAPPGSRAPPSALAEINLFFFLVDFLLVPLFKNPEGVVVGFQIFAWAFWKYLKEVSLSSETSDMTPGGFGEMFEGDSADTGAWKFPLVLMGGRAEGLACADPGERNPISVSRNWSERSACDQRSALRWPLF
jgi:hypothetical protein